MRCWPQLLTRSSWEGNSASMVSIGTSALSAISGHVVAWTPWLPCSSSVLSMIRSRVGSTSRRSPGSSPAAPSKPRRRASCQNCEPGDRFGGGRLLERAPAARAQLPEHLAADLAPGDEAALQQPAAGTAHLGVIGLQQAAELRASQPRRGVEHTQEVVRLGSLGYGGPDGTRSIPQCSNAMAASSHPISSWSPSTLAGRRGACQGQRPGSRRRLRAGRRPGRAPRPRAGPGPRRGSLCAALARRPGDG